MPAVGVHPICILYIYIFPDRFSQHLRKLYKCLYLKLIIDSRIVYNDFEWTIFPHFFHISMQIRILNFRKRIEVFEICKICIFSPLDMLIAPDMLHRSKLSQIGNDGVVLRRFFSS